MIHNRETELRKRFALQDDLARERQTPLADQLLDDEERQAIAERVRTGLIRQAIWPMHGGIRGSVG